MTAANRIIIYLLRQERRRLVNKPGSVFRLLEIGQEIERRLLSL